MKRTRGRLRDEWEHSAKKKGKINMKLRWLWVPLLICGFYASPAMADNRVIVRTTLGLQGLQAICNPLPLLQNCTVVAGLDGTLNQLFLVTTPLDLTTFLNLLGSTVGIVDAEADQLLSLVGGLNQVTTPPAGLSDTTPVNYSGSTVWDGDDRLYRPTAFRQYHQHRYRKSIDRGRTRPVHCRGAGHLPIRRFWSWHDGNGHHPLGRSSGAAAAAQGLQFRRDRILVQHFARCLLRRAGRREHYQHELRHDLELAGVFQGHGLRQPERRDLRRFRGE